MLKRGTRLSEMKMVALSVRLCGSLHVHLLKKSVECVVLRHESLRTRVASIDGTFIQYISPLANYRFEEIDLSSQPACNSEAQARKCAQEFVDTKIDLTIGPLFEALLVKLGSQEHVLVFAIDHFVSDGVSILILNREIWAAYDQAVNCQEIALPPLPIQFADFAAWQERTNDTWRERHEPYWRQRLNDAPLLQTSSKDGLTGGGYLRERSLLYFSISASLRVRISEVARRERTLPSLVLLTAYAVAMSYWYRRRDLLVAFVSHGRHGHPELENMIGHLASPLYLRLEIAEGDTYRDLLSRLIGEFRRAESHKDFGRVADLFPELCGELSFHWAATEWGNKNRRYMTINHGLLKVHDYEIWPGDQQPSRARIGVPRSPPKIPTVILSQPIRAGDLHVPEASEPLMKILMLSLEMFIASPFTPLETAFNHCEANEYK